MTFSFLIRFSIVFLIIMTPALLQASEIKVVLTANTADFRDKDELFLMMDQYCNQTNVPVNWILNGDVFLSSASQEDIQQWLQRATQLLDKYPQLTMLVNQGDREWDHSGKGGWKRIRQLEKLISKTDHGRLHFFFEDGCPGPWLFSVSQHVDIILMNSQWWNHPYDKPMSYMNLCSIADEGVFLEKVSDLIEESKSKNVLLLSHFPLLSLGNYGGRFPVSSYLLPPVAGSAIVSFRQTVGTRDDIVNTNFEGIRKKLLDITGDYNSLIIASGHERNHSILKAGDNYHINSGAMSHGDFVAADNQALLTSSKAGFIELTYQSTGAVSSAYFHWKDKRLVEKQKDVLINASVNEPIVSSSTESLHQNEQTVVAGPEYNISQWAQLWLGAHYRESWLTPVKVPYLNLDTTFRGLTVVRKGGGRQTTSLKLTGGNGKEYVFRSVDKDPSRALSHDVRGTVVSQLVKDQTTTQQPYGALAASYLLDQINVLHARPQLYVLPTDSSLGDFRDQYGNLLGMLEDSPTDKIQHEKIFGAADHIERSYKLFRKLYEDHDNHVDRLEFCRARVFDILVGDWGKHEDNWKWAGYDQKGGVVYRPIPRDRDHVFSRWDGFLPFLADREWAKETGENFDYKIKGLRSLMAQARHMDRLLGNQLTKEDWINAAKEIQHSISDEDIEQAIRRMPAEIYAKDGKEIEAKLKQRIKDLPVYAAEYYTMLARQVDVVGSNKAEYFGATRNADGSVSVVVCDLDKGSPDFNKVYYRRTLFPEETKEIRLYGLTNNDQFVITGKSDRSILIRIINGDQKDVIADSSEVRGSSDKTLIYTKGDHTINTGSEARLIRPKNVNLYHYERTAFAYNTYFPLVLLTYNPFTGLALNTSVTFTNHNFSKPDFSIRHHISGSVSTKGNYEFGYRTQYRYLVGRWDGIAGVNLSRPLNYNYFFGVGNDTQRDKDVSSAYYRAQYNSLLFSAGLTRSFWKRSSVSILANYEHAQGVARVNSFLENNQMIFGMDKLHMTGLKTILNFDFRDDRFLPEKGFRFEWDQEVLHVDHADRKLSSIASVAMEHYLSTHNQNPITLGLRAGAGWTSGDLPFYKLFSLGQLDNLHGFRRNRFTGESKAYLNTELRWQIVETRNNFIPVKVGVRAFYDLGRVWAESDPDSANYWHEGYGAGFYVTPFMNQLSLNVNVGSSKEESLLLMFGIGGTF